VHRTIRDRLDEEVDGGLRLRQGLPAHFIEGHALQEALGDFGCGRGVTSCGLRAHDGPRDRHRARWTHERQRRSRLNVQDGEGATGRPGLTHLAGLDECLDHPDRQRPSFNLCDLAPLQDLIDGLGDGVEVALSKDIAPELGVIREGFLVGLPYVAVVVLQVMPGGEHWASLLSVFQAAGVVVL
jgi:hypothetical protein